MDRSEVSEDSPTTRYESKNRVQHQDKTEVRPADTAIASTELGRQNQHAMELANQTLGEPRLLDGGAIVNDPGTLQCGLAPNLACTGSGSR